MRGSRPAILLVALIVVIPACARNESAPKANEPNDSAAPNNGGTTDSKGGRQHTVTPVKRTPVETLQQLGGEVELDENGEPQSVTLAACRAVNADLTLLRGMKSLETLNLFRTEITDVGLVHLKNLTGLRGLVLSETAVTDEGMRRLGGLTTLETLDLEGTAITDEGLRHLHGLTRLSWLSLVATKVTDAGVEEFRQALPELRIDR